MDVSQLKRSDVAPAWAKSPFSVEEILSVLRAARIPTVDLLARYPDVVESVLLPVVNRAPISARAKLRKKGIQPPLSEAQMDEWIQTFLRVLVSSGAMTEDEVQQGLKDIAAS